MPRARPLRPGPPRDPRASTEEPIRPTGPEPAPFETLPGDVIRPGQQLDDEERRRRKRLQQDFSGRQEVRTILHVDTEA